MASNTATVATPPSLRRRRARLSMATLVSLIILGFWTVVAVLGPLILPHDPTDFISDDSFAAAGGAWLGTDHMGRDLASRLLGGARVTLGMSVLAALIAHLLGGSLGVLGAIRGGVIDAVASRVVDVLLSLPKIVVGLVVVAVLGPSLTVLVAMAGIVYACGVFRIARALAADVLVIDFVRAARARGEGTAWIMFGEVLPNIIRPLAADFAIRVSFAILFISSLGFLGLGVQPPLADWGALVHDNISGLAAGSFAPIWPALAIASVTISLNLLVDSWTRGRDGGSAHR
ncbi:ABC transporter permease [Roseomonas sp. ACRSG]|nr:ABC transporter permease [Roseomonas sp. ACRSG]